MTSTTPSSLPLDPQLRADAESVLQDGESLSAFVENSVKVQIDYRRVQTEFFARALASREEAKSTGVYYSEEEVMAELKTMRESKLADLTYKAG